MKPGPAALALSVVASGVTALWLRFNAPPSERGLTYPHDLLYSYLPKMELVGRRLAAGELALWNPDGCGGTPLLAAMQPAVLYPPTWIAALLPAEAALALLLLLHLLIGAAGAAMLFRSFGLDPLVAGAFGCLFVFTCALGQSFWPPQVATLVWLPWILLATDRTIGSRSIGGGWITLALVTALQLLAGFPQYVLYGLQLTIPYATLRAFQAGSFRASAHGLVRVATAMLLGLCISAAQLVPAAELIAASERNETLSAAEIHYLNPRPQLDARLANAVSPAVRPLAFELPEATGYLGTGTLVLLAVAIAGWRREPLVLLFAGFGGLCLLLADGYLGAASGLFELYAKIPVVGNLRAPERLLFGAWWAAVALAALGARSCLRALASRGERRKIELVAGVVAAIGIAVVGTDAVLWRAAAAGALVAFAYLAPPGTWLRYGWGALLALFLLVDIAAVTGPHGSFRSLPRAWAERIHIGGHPILEPAAVEAQRARAGQGRIEFTSRGFHIRPIAGVGPLAGMSRLACYETPSLANWAAARRLMRRGDFASIVAANIDPVRFATFLDAASVFEITTVETSKRAKRRLSANRYAKDAIPQQPLPHGATVTSEENADALPRAYLVDQYEIEEDSRAVVRLVGGTFDPQTVVLLDADPALPSSGRIPRALPASIEHYAAERVEISFDAPSAAMLVLTDTSYVGWVASIDGEAAPIFLANGLFRAIRVPPGRHRAVFEYRPTSFRVGASISALALLATLGVPALARVRRSRLQAPARTA